MTFVVSNRFYRVCYFLSLPSFRNAMKLQCSICDNVLANDFYTVRSVELCTMVGLAFSLGLSVFLLLLTRTLSSELNDWIILDWIN